MQKTLFKTTQRWLFKLGTSQVIGKGVLGGSVTGAFAQVPSISGAPDARLMRAYAAAADYPY